jgi:NADPH:quinone reductase-like Zn-dependent oxidoreductase
MAAGGVGLLALQIMKRRLKDVTVVALAGSDEKVELVRSHGADHAIPIKLAHCSAAPARVVAFVS